MNTVILKDNGALFCDGKLVSDEPACALGCRLFATMGLQGTVWFPNNR